jgi:hypothetical protein
MARSAFITYHLAHLMLHINLSDLVIAAGDLRGMDGQGEVTRDRRTFIQSAKSERPGADAYRYALEVVAMSLVEKVPNPVAFSSISSRKKSLSPFHTAFTGYIGALVLWAMQISTCHNRPSRREDHYLTKLIKRGEVGLVSQGHTRDEWNQEENWFRELLNVESSKTMLKENQPEYRVQGIQRLVRLVEHRLSGSRWEIGTSVRGLPNKEYRVD